MAMEQARYHDRVVEDPEIMVGKPVVRDTRIPVELVLDYLARNPSFDDLFADYPRLTMDDVKACFAYARSMVGKRRRRATTTPPTVGGQATS